MAAETKAIHLRYQGKLVRIRLTRPDDHIQSTLLSSQRFYEEDLLAALFARLFPPNGFIDVGANIGNHSLFVAGVLGLPVAAFEPFPMLKAELDENVRLNELEHLVSTFDVALGAQARRGTLLPAGEANSGQGRVIADGGVSTSDGASGEVEIRRLDDVVLPFIPGAIKIDVEGAELDVLHGASRTIERHGPMLFVEAPTQDAFGAIRDYLAQQGYRPTRRFCVTPTYLFERRAS